MDKVMRYSAIPVGQTFRFNGELLIKSTQNRGLKYYDGKLVAKRFKKHELVEWVNAWPTQLEG